MTQHHFVPQTYLKGFATPDDPERVWFYDRRIQDKGVNKRLIEDVCSQNNLYRLLMDDGTEKDDLEQEFATIAEPTFRAIVGKLLARESLTNQEKSEFAAYIGLQIIRTPASRDIYNSMATEIWDQATKNEWRKLLDDAQREKTFDDIKQSTGVNVSAFTKEDVQGLIDGTRFQTKWTIPKENWIRDNMANLPRVFQAFERMHWRVFFAPQGSAFITSDNPVGVLVPQPGGWYVGTGYLSKGSVRVFPLSKKACLTIVDNEPSGFSFVDADKRGVRQMNNVTACSHHNILLGDNPKLVEKCLKRVPEGFNLTEEIKRRQVEQLRMAGLHS